MFLKEINNLPPEEAMPEGQTICVSPVSQSLMLPASPHLSHCFGGTLGEGCLPLDSPSKLGAKSPGLLCPFTTISCHTFQHSFLVLFGVPSLPQKVSCHL